MAGDLSRYGIRVNCVAPGLVRTPMSRAERDELGEALLAIARTGRTGSPSPTEHGGRRSRGCCPPPPRSRPGTSFPSTAACHPSRSPRSAAISRPAIDTARQEHCEPRPGHRRRLRYRCRHRASTLAARGTRVSVIDRTAQRGQAGLVAQGWTSCRPWRGVGRRCRGPRRAGGRGRRRSRRDRTQRTGHLRGHLGQGALPGFDRRGLAHQSRHQRARHGDRPAASVARAWSAGARRLDRDRVLHGRLRLRERARRPLPRDQGRDQSAHPGAGHRTRAPTASGSTRSRRA